MIHMRALALGAFDQHAAANQAVEFIVSNPNGDKVFRQTINTSAFGIASVDFQLASQLVTGKYTLQAIMGDTESTRTVEVKPYTLPKYKVSIETNRPYYLPNSRVEGYVQADYFFGKPTAQARVELRGYAYDPDRRQVIELFGQTDAQGRYKFAFDLPSYQMSGVDRADFGIEIAVIDQAEHREETSRVVTVAPNPLLIDAVPESGKLRVGVENIVYILVSTPDGRPARASLSVNGDALQTGDYGLAEYRFVPEARGASKVPRAYTLNISAKDATGAAASKTLRLDAEQQPETVLLRVERAAYRVGDTLKAEALTTGQGGAVYLDVVKDSQTIAAVSAPVKDGRAVFAFDLDAEMFGTLELHAYRILAGGQIARDTRLVVVDRAQDVTIDIKSNQPVYRPGQTAGVAFTTTQAGSPAQTALGIGIVDESVYAVQDQAPGFARLYFLLEKELLEPRQQVNGFDVPTLLAPVDDATKKAQDAAAKASWAGTPTTLFGLDIRSRVEKLAQLARQRLIELKNVAEPLGRALIVLPLLMCIVVVWGLRASGVLGKALLETAKWVGFALLASPLLVFGLAVALALAAISQTLGWMLIFAAAVLWVVEWALLALYGWRRDDPRAQLAAGLAMAYTALFGLILCIAEIGGDPTPNIILGTTAAFMLMVLAFVALGQGLRLEGQRQAAWASSLMGLMWLPLIMLAATVFAAHSVLAQTVGNPMTYIGPVGWLAGCGPAAPVAKETMPTPQVLMPTKAPEVAAQPRPTATPVVQAQPGKPGQAAAGEPVRVRQYFPETMYWNPEALTDAQGRLQLEIPLADSITTWRLTALASTQDGRIGSQTYGLRVFQDFFIDLDLPGQLTVGDEIAVPVAVYNYLTQTQQVKLEVTSADWFELMDEPNKTVSIGPNDIDVSYFRIRVTQFGAGRMTVYGRGSALSDAIAKEVNVAPNGKQVRVAKSDYLTGDTTAVIALPTAIVNGAARIEVKVYAGPAAQIVEGLDALLRMPNGCFEQTSSTLYPDVLVLDYLNRTGRAAPEVRMKAEQYIAAGYQRLLTYEVEGGGFSLFGEKPATLMHTAYGLMEFSDMSRVYAVDPAIIDRTAQWLLAQQNSDGSWGGEGTAGYMESWGTLRNSRLPTTAYITWALIAAGQPSQASRGLEYLGAHWNEAADAYSLALVANALVAANDSRAQTVLDKLAAYSVRENDTARWAADAQSFTGASGDVADLETTALATQALVRSGSHREVALAALRYLTRSKDSFGTWQSTQATILSLKAFLTALDLQSAPPEAAVSVALNSGPAQSIRLTPDNADVVHILTFDDGITPGENAIRLQVSGQNIENLMYQVTASAYTAWSDTPVDPNQPIDINIAYDRTELSVGDELQASVNLTLKNPPPVQWGIVELGVPPGFDVVSEDLDTLVAQSTGLVTKVRRYELTGSHIVLYLENLDYKISFSYRLRAKVPLKAQTSPSTVYDYYNPETSGSQGPALVSVVARP
jgi:uncharacterized protein YfaS (alpha-2-macroglobulin family)